MQTIGTELGAQLREAYRLPGSPPQLDVSPSLIPVVNALTLDDSPWHGKRGFSGWGAASAANNAYFCIGLDADARPDARLVLKRIGVASQSAGAFSLARLNAVDSSGSEWDCPDWDQSPVASPGFARSPLQAWIGSTAAAAGTVIVGGLQTSGGFLQDELSGPFILGPGMFLSGRMNAAGIVAVYSVYGDIYGL